MEGSPAGDSSERISKASEWPSTEPSSEIAKRPLLEK